MPGDMHVGDARTGYAGDIRRRIEVEIDAVDEDVIHIKQQLAVSLLQHGTHKAQLIQLARQLRIGRDILDDQRPLQHVLHDAHTLGDTLHRLLGKGQRHQVVQLAVVSTGRQMLAVGAHTMLLKKAFDGLEQRDVQRGKTA